MSSMGKLLILAGAVIMAVGLVLLLNVILRLCFRK